MGSEWSLDKFILQNIISLNQNIQIMPINKLFVNSIKKSFVKFDLTRLDERCTNEAQTRQIIIEPLLEILGYSRIDDQATEIIHIWNQPVTLFS